jgi:hypothetical protein
VQESIHQTHGASLSRDLRIAVIDQNPLLKKELETAICRPAATPVAFDGPAFSSNDIPSYLAALKAKRQG